MPFDNSGNFVRDRGRATWQSDASAKVKIKSDLHDINDNDIADGLSNTICRDGQSTITADIPWGGKKITNLGAAVNPTDAVNYGQISNIPNINGMPVKAAPVDADEMMIANSASAPPWQKAKLTLLTLKTFIYQSFGVFLHAGNNKPVIVDADEFAVADSVSTPTAWVQARHTWANLKAMIGIGPGQRLAPNQGPTPVADANDAFNTGWYATIPGTSNIPLAQHGYLTVQSFDAAAGTAGSVMQEWVSLPGTVSYRRYRSAAAWQPWVNTTSINALRKDVDGTIAANAFISQAQSVNGAPGVSYTPPITGVGNLRQIYANGTLQINRPAAGEYTMVVYVWNAAAATITLSGFNRVVGDPPHTAAGGATFIYITSIAGICIANVVRAS